MKQQALKNLICETVLRRHGTKTLDLVSILINDPDVVDGNLDQAAYHLFDTVIDLVQEKRLVKINYIIKPDHLGSFLLPAETEIQP